MKKIIIAVLVIFIAQNITAQSTAPADAKQMTIAEAKSLQGNVEPTINGIPYSQYKAQQDALKQQNTKQQTASNLPKGLIPINGGSTEKPAAAATQKTVDVKGTSFEPVKPVEKKAPAKNEKAEPSSVNG